MFRFAVRMVRVGEEALRAAAMSWERVRCVWRERRVRGVVFGVGVVEVDILSFDGCVGWRIVLTMFAGTL
jgi:hypothetical protein